MANSAMAASTLFCPKASPTKKEAHGGAQWKKPTMLKCRHSTADRNPFPDPFAALNGL